jgi:hypothetical protein
LPTYVSNTTGNEEAENATFDLAVDQVLQRVLGLPGDKTHGGRFLSVAETPEYVSYVQEDPAISFPNRAGFVGTFTYYADDVEYIG